MAARGGFLHDNLLLLAAVALPLAVVLLFLVASAVPRWLVAPPAYDLVLRREGTYNPARPGIAVDLAVHDGRVEATFRPMPRDAHPQIPRLLLLEHQTMNVREIPLDPPPDLKEGDPPVTVPVGALAGRRVVAATRAPDGYEMDARGHRNTGFLGSLFGMRSRGDSVSLVNRGRVIRLALPSDTSGYGVTAVGWVVE